MNAQELCESRGCTSDSQGGHRPPLRETISDLTDALEHLVEHGDDCKVIVRLGLLRDLGGQLGHLLMHALELSVDDLSAEAQAVLRGE